MLCRVPYPGGTPDEGLLIVPCMSIFLCVKNFSWCFSDTGGRADSLDNNDFKFTTHTPFITSEDFATCEPVSGLSFICIIRKLQVPICLIPFLPPPFVDLIASFDELYREGVAGSPKMFSIGLHCRIIGKPGRIGGLRKFIEHAQKHEGVWFATREQIADHWAATPF